MVVAVGEAWRRGDVGWALDVDLKNEGKSEAAARTIEDETTNKMDRGVDRRRWKSPVCCRVSFEMRHEMPEGGCRGRTQSSSSTAEDVGETAIRLAGQLVMAAERTSTCSKAAGGKLDWVFGCRKGGEEGKESGRRGGERCRLIGWRKRV